MKKVIIYAYTNFNLGDDLFIKVLCERYPRTNFILYAQKDYKYSLSEVENLKIFPSDSFINRGINFILRVLKIQWNTRKFVARSCDAIVNIGGSIFIQRENWEKSISIRKNMQVDNKPFFVLGSNFGPFNDKRYYTEYKEIFKTYTDICFREEYSYKLFSDLDNVRMADDVVFQLKKPEVKVEYKNIVISVIKPSFRKYLKDYDNIYYEKIKAISIYFIDRGYKVTLMSFCEGEGDKEAVEIIMNKIPAAYKNNITSHLYKFNMEETLNVIAKSNFVVATRFHSMILGWIYNKPVFPISYSKKMTNVMEDVGFNGLYTDFENIYNLKPEDVFNNMNSNLINVSKQIKKSEEQFEKLDSFLIK